MSKGKLIVIDGTDGSGKATQTKLLIKRLRKTGKKVRMVDFPQYGKKSAGLVEDYLNGLYGSSEELGSYIPSIFYAADRFAASRRIADYLKKGYTVICNRYTTSNMAHQGGKIKDLKQRQKYFKWLDELEFKLFKIPKPDLSLILHVPAKIAQKLVDKKARRFYIGGRKRDMHEKDIGHIIAAERTYLEIAKKFGYPVIECVKNGKLLKPKEIHETIFKFVRNSS
ncbi:MAG: thymidylate kinase [Candidatus Doudnabacteria bacterium]|nr:thymidylate kinase [Candidatus Doudnabacteria bacterium]